MNHRRITTAAELQQYCRWLADCPSIAFDTEFVSEHTYRPVLCLIQVAAQGELAVIDPLAIGDVKPFWERLAAPGHVTIVHAGRGEVEFSLRAVGHAPTGLFDVQLAAGLVGAEYPSGYHVLVSRILRQRLKKHETRTDWRRRPLSKRQLDYALQDVIYLPALYDALQARLRESNRTVWMEEEMADWLVGVQKALSHERWRRVSGNAGLDRRELAILRELFHWREAEAKRRDQPVRRVLRDDLIVELARRQSADPQRIGAVRGMERGDLRKRLPQLAECVQRGLDVPEADLPVRIPGDQLPQLSVLGQLLFAALGSLCREADLSPSLVGTPNDLRELIVYRDRKKSQNSPLPKGEGQGVRADLPKNSPHPSPLPRGEGTSHRKIPRLARGWRAEFVGRLFEDLLDGKLAIRIADADSDAPLKFEP
ncbi:MAG: HRDC domain-containing protein [Pirellulales bacterium]|nr:HRDC domain-containing protein [Pirellulales bacterium]